MLKKVKIGVTRTFLTLLSSAVFSSGYFYYNHKENEIQLAELNTAYTELAFTPEVLNDSYNKELTYDYLNSIKDIKVDLQKTNNLDELSKMPNLEYLIVESAEWVTPEILDQIRSYGIKEITLSFNNINVNKEHLIDLDELQDFDHVSLYYYTNDDHDALIYYDKYSNNPYDNISIRIGGEVSYRMLTDEYVKKLKKETNTWNISDKDDEYITYLSTMDNALNEILSNIDFKEDDSEITKMYRIYDYVITKLEFDPDILAYGNGEIEKTIKVDNLMKKYAYHGLSSTLFSDKDITNGICTTYTDLFDILCYKMNVPTRIQCGMGNQVLGHAWNTYMYDDDISCLDLSSTDNEKTLKYIEEYLSYNTEAERNEHLKEVISHTLIDPITYSDMDLIKDYDNLYKKEEVKPEYYNKGFDKKVLVMNKWFLFQLILVGLGGAISYNLIYSLADYLGLTPSDYDDYKKLKRK